MLKVFDLAIVGSGFAGSLLALIARRLGHSVILLEKGWHPRFVIGESSTPLANLLLEELSTRYDLPAVAPLAKWGSWQQQVPEISCGLKRGFSFFHHRFGEAAAAEPLHRNQLLVAASSRDAVADTHWYRPEFDAYLMGQAQDAGVEYLDRVQLRAPAFVSDGVELEGQRLGIEYRIRAGFLVDATGPRGFLHQTLPLAETAFTRLPATEALFTHFRDVRRLERLGLFDNDREPPPFPVDDAAMHHVFDGGWIWVLRFNNGLTSAGAVMTSALADQLGRDAPAAAWSRLLERLLTVREQFRGATPALEFHQLRPLSFQSASIVGPRWALLPSSAGFVDPLLSTGFTLTLLGVSRLAALFEENWAKVEAGLHSYAESTRQELLTVEHLVAALYAHMGDPTVFNNLALVYFAPVSFAEISQRVLRRSTGYGFLLHDHPQFGPRFRSVCDQALQLGRNSATDASARRRLISGIQAAIEPIDVTGLHDLSRCNWYDLRPSDLLESAPKLGASRAQVESFLSVRT